MNFSHTTDQLTLRENSLTQLRASDDHDSNITATYEKQWVHVGWSTPGPWPASLCSRCSRMTWRKEWAYVWTDTDSSCRMVKNDTAAVNCISTPATCRASCTIRKSLLLHRWDIRSYNFLKIQGHRNQTVIVYKITICDL